MIVPFNKQLFIKPNESLEKFSSFMESKGFRNELFANTGFRQFTDERDLYIFINKPISKDKFQNLSKELKKIEGTYFQEATPVFFKDHSTYFRFPSTNKKLVNTVYQNTLQQHSNENLRSIVLLTPAEESQGAKSSRQETTGEILYFQPKHADISESIIAQKFKRVGRTAGDNQFSPGGRAARYYLPESSTKIL